MNNIVSLDLAEVLHSLEAKRAIRKALRLAINGNASEFEIFSLKSRLNKVQDEHDLLLTQLDQLEADGPDAIVSFFTSINR